MWLNQPYRSTQGCVFPVCCIVQVLCTSDHHLSEPAIQLHTRLCVLCVAYYSNGGSDSDIDVCPHPWVHTGFQWHMMFLFSTKCSAPCFDLRIPKSNLFFVSPLRWRSANSGPRKKLTITILPETNNNRSCFVVVIFCPSGKMWTSFFPLFRRGRERVSHLSSRGKKDCESGNRCCSFISQCCTPLWFANKLMLVVPIYSRWNMTVEGQPLQKFCAYVF